VLETDRAGVKNGEPSALAEKAGFQVFLTSDREIEYRKHLAAGGIAVVRLSLQSNRLADLEPQVLVIGALLSFEPGQLVKAGSGTNS
jgi:hypothetical protein